MNERSEEMNLENVLTRGESSLSTLPLGLLVIVEENAKNINNS